MKIKITALLLLVVSQLVLSQTMEGIVSDSQKKPLRAANIIAKPISTGAKLKFAIADENGIYRLALEKGVSYNLLISYLGYKSQSAVINAFDGKTLQNFLLVPENEELKEIVIKNDFKPLIIKTDTLIYDVKSFTSGTERKLKEQLLKLPGVEVDKNGTVTVQGKKVTKFLVEGDLFFGGGTKLGVENIPADAVSKVEVIDHFSQIGFLKTVSNSDDLAMNIKLKADKKRFVFGDIEAAAEVANNNNYYRAHTGLFYYSTKANLSFIGDINSIGTSAFDFGDMIRLQGGASSFFSKSKNLANLSSFIDDNRDFEKNISKLSALNFSIDYLPKLKISGFLLSSAVSTNFRTQIKNLYLQNSSSIEEDVLQQNANQITIGIANLKLEYNPRKNEKIDYNIQLKTNTNQVQSNLATTSSLNTTTFDTNFNTPNYNVTHFIEWHKSINDYHSFTLAVNQIYETDQPQNQWLADQPFFNNGIVLQADSRYDVRQIKALKNNTIDALFKHYWILNNANHIYTSIGLNSNFANLTTSESQFLTNGSQINFNTELFGNNLYFGYKNLFAGIEYKRKIGKFTFTPALFLHNYNLSTIQIDSKNYLSKIVLLPQFKCVYDFNKTENFNFNYQLSTNFPTINQLHSKLVFQNYNTLFTGNSSIQNELFHSATIIYTKLNFYRGITINGTFRYNRKIETIRDQIQLTGINQILTPKLTSNPESNWFFMGSFSKNINKFIVKLNSNISWLKYTQTINTISNVNNRSDIQVGIVIKTGRKFWLDAEISYSKNFNQFSGITTSNFQKEELNINCEKSFLKNFIIKFDYQFLENKNNIKQRNNYDILNASVRYQKPNSPLSFELFANNLINTTSKNNFMFTDFLITQQQTNVLPRIIMLSLNYKI